MWLCGHGWKAEHHRTEGWPQRKNNTVCSSGSFQNQENTLVLLFLRTTKRVTWSSRKQNKTSNCRATPKVVSSLERHAGVTTRLCDCRQRARHLLTTDSKLCDPRFSEGTTQTQFYTNRLPWNGIWAQQCSWRIDSLSKPEVPIKSELGS